MLIGKVLTRDEDNRLVQRQGNDVDDIDLPGAAYAAFVHIPGAHHVEMPATPSLRASCDRPGGG